jgi:hypothetical protein
LIRQNILIVGNIILGTFLSNWVETNLSYGSRASNQPPFLIMRQIGRDSTANSCSSQRFFIENNNKHFNVTTANKTLKVAKDGSEGMNNNERWCDFFVNRASVDV